MRSSHFLISASLLVAWSTAGCREQDRSDGDIGHVLGCEHEISVVRTPRSHPPARAAAPIAVASMDRAPRVLTRAAGELPLPVEARFLVLTGEDTGADGDLGAIREALDYDGVPYDIFIASKEPPLTAARLASGDLGLYQATILTDSALAVGSQSGLSEAEWEVLATYEARFHVRRAVLNTWPEPELGFGEVMEADTEATPITIACTAAGAAVFRDVNCAQGQQIKNAWTYLSRPSDPSLTPLLADAQGHALAAIHTGSDGRESLLFLFANAPFLVHSKVFMHGVLGWVSGGTYLGERRVYLSAQVDDLFLSTDLGNGTTYRIDAPELRAALAWQKRHAADPMTPDFRLSWAFNGVAAADGDPLTAEVEAQRGQWHWISHTFTHRLLDRVDYATAMSEFMNNNETADELRLTGYDRRNIVTPGVSGLANAEAMHAAVAAGLRFAVSDTSREGCDNPTPNTAFYDALAPDLLLIPRHPTDMFVKVSTPDEWVAAYEEASGDWLAYDDLVDMESDELLFYLLRGDADPWMFHQANLRAYDGTRSILGDLLDATIAKYETHLTVPIATPPMDELGLRFASRMEAEAAGVRATLLRGRALLIDAARTVSVAVTGVGATAGESYGGDRIQVVAVAPGATTCVPLDDAGQGCSPAPTRAGGPGPTQELVARVCDSSSATDPGAPQPPGGCAVGASRPAALGTVALAALAALALRRRRRRWR